MTRRQTLLGSLSRRLPLGAPSYALNLETTTTLSPLAASQRRQASYIPRPLLPPQFTQLVRQSDGATFTWRTSSPLPLHSTVSQRDSRNHPLWQPSDASLKGIEADEAGRLRAFRGRYGRGWDLATGEEEEQERQSAAVMGDGAVTEADLAKEKEEERVLAAEVEEEDAEDESLGDLISSYATEDNASLGPLRRKDKEEGAKKEKKKKRRGFL